MKLIEYPDLATCRQSLQRPAANLAWYRQQVAPILEAVKERGDAALREFSAKFDGYAGESLEISAAEARSVIENLPQELKTAIDTAYRNIRAFHHAQHEPEIRVETTPGVWCSRRSIAIDKVGLYIPGGTAPLFSTVLMLGAPAQLAGCREIVLCTPPDKSGQVHPAMLYAAMLCGVHRIFRIGGAQAIAAMTYGTETVPQVYKIFGPGNPWVTAAKQLASLDGVAIDMPAGPSEVAIIADKNANPAFVAADLLSQAEHGADSQVVLFSDNAGIIKAVMREIKEQLSTLPRKEFAAEALQKSAAVLVGSMDEALEFCNDYAPEHLILQVDDPEKQAGQVRNAGSVFLGAFSPESAGDYASGTNHTLPTGGYARAYAGVSLDSFVKKVTFQQISAEGLAKLKPAIVAMAEAEQLDAHARAVSIRVAGLPEEAAAKQAPAPRPNIAALKPYSSARDEFSGIAAIQLDANENSLGSPLPDNFNRYPNPPDILRQLIASRKKISPASVFLGNGSDEAIDLLLRAYCTPGRDNVLILPPTYGMYAVQAAINDVEIRKAPLTPDFQIDPEAVCSAVDVFTKVIFICSPNNPSGNSLDPTAIESLLKWFPGIVVIDEAYADFSTQPSWTGRLSEFPNLVILQTLSKAWGLAGLRLGMAFAAPEIISVLNKIKYPYNLNTATIKLAENALRHGATEFAQNLAILIRERDRLKAALPGLPSVKKVFPSNANFLLVQVSDADAIYRYLADNGVIVRNRSREMHCENCLRMTIGKPEENDRLLELLTGFSTGS